MKKKAGIKLIILAIFYIACLPVGLILNTYIGDNLNLLGLAFIMNFSNGFLCFAFYKNLKIKIAFKIALFLISISIIVLAYIEYAKLETESYLYMLLPVLVNIVGVCSLGIARIVLCKEKTYVFLNFAIFPISLLFANIFGGFEIILTVCAIIFLIVSGLSVIYFGGDVHYGYGTFQTRYTVDGHKMTRIDGNIYCDETTGIKYTYSTDGIFTEIK